MNKAEKILEYIHKMAHTHGITYEEAEQLQITQEYIKNVEGDYEEMEINIVSGCNSADVQHTG